jgi:hypothetical protein
MQCHFEIAEDHQKLIQDLNEILLHVDEMIHRFPKEPRFEGESLRHIITEKLMQYKPLE